MGLQALARNYFKGFHEIWNCPKNCAQLNALNLLKMFSYFILAIPVGYAAVYAAASLYGRISKNPSLSKQDQQPSNRTAKTFFSVHLPKPIPPSSLLKNCRVNIQPFINEAKIFAQQRRNAYGDPDKLLKYIHNKLETKEFQNNPRLFMNKWKRERGLTDELRVPEDQAMAFFEKKVMPHIR
ncbi:hypothetical protein DB42_DE00090 [Neochlamydia sp. EPS4]|uniref:hypothetical protein n=1 Tax=Neochlamydia sp. EPS4 TaxID=1478175 RepID=UPI00058245CA|nr:hypothetical protein [Neochlamydia sp. EPS4]KIC72363.1 hypothetical protein DB42_DE00090 [Neochlamydia sp. EPS4]